MLQDPLVPLGTDQPQNAGLAGEIEENTMWKQVAVAGGVGAAVLGIGTAALAATGTTTPPAPKPPAAGKMAHHHPAHHRTVLSGAIHAQWTTHNRKTGANLTHDIIRGKATVSGSTITVQAVDGSKQTFSVSSSTKIMVKGQPKGTPGQLSQVKSGDNVVVIGTGTTNLSATQIHDQGVPKPRVKHSKAPATAPSTTTPSPATTG